MKAWQLTAVHDMHRDTRPLVLADVPDPVPGPNEILISVSCCGVCHTELDEIEGRTPPAVYPVIPGHQVVGVVAEAGRAVTKHRKGDRVGVAWIHSACGNCEYCLSGRENLCPSFRATGRDTNGGYAPYMTVGERFAYKIPDVFSDAEAAPLLCAGAIGYRSLKLTGMKDGDVLGLTGFGASGHLVLKLARFQYPRSKVFVFARSVEEQQFALELGADWAGNTTAAALEHCHVMIDTTPAWLPVTASLLQLRPGGRLVINAIRKEAGDQDALLGMTYHDQLWMEKEIKSVANITRDDVEAFLEIAAQIPITPAVETYPADKANEALMDLKQRHVRGAKVLIFH